MTAPRTPGATLGQLALAIAGARVLGESALIVTDVFQDSRRVTEGSLFCVRGGEKRDGRAFVDDALARGAAAVMTDDEALAGSLAVPVLLVVDAREAVGPASLEVHGRPDHAVCIIGITGTNGKTTTSHLVGAMLRAAGKRPAVLGTLGCIFEEVAIQTGYTTPEGDEIARIAAQVAALGATHLVMEVSSHALSLGRVAGLRFEVAAFTNLTQDHLDFHPSMEAYGEAKATLFTELGPRRSIVCVDGAFGKALAKRAEGEVLAVSTSDAPEASIRVIERRIDAGGIVARVATPEGEVDLRSRLVGAHNLENLVVALGIGLAAGMSAEAAIAGLASAPAVPGRLERVSEDDDDVLVAVDYAHTPDALTSVLSALRPLTSGELWCVFGCGGDRDAQKRPKMGEAVALGADRIIVTNDNPRSEDPEAIAAAIAPGIERAGRPFETILDRSIAIDRAVSSAARGDVVLIAGKGHETYQIVGDEVRAFDDRTEARRALETRRQRAR